MTASRLVLAVTLALGLLVAPLAAGAQPDRTVRIGWLALEPIASDLQVFRQALSELGYVEGRTLVIEQRYGHRQPERYAGLAAELVRLPVDVIVSTGVAPTEAARRATATVPIVFFVGPDPVALGLVASLARPGGNLTGFTVLTEDLTAKRVEVLKETVPGMVRLAVLTDATVLPSALATQRQSAEAAARQWRLQLLPALDVRTADDLDGAFARAAQGQAGGLLVMASQFFGSVQQRIIALAAKTRLPAIYVQGTFVEAGGLLAYGPPGYRDAYRRAAAYVDRILKGTKPADLPVEQPTRIELAVNLKTARALGLTIPPTVLARADKIIE